MLTLRTWLGDIPAELGPIGLYGRRAAGSMRLALGNHALYKTVAVGLLEFVDNSDPRSFVRIVQESMDTLYALAAGSQERLVGGRPGIKSRLGFPSSYFWLLILFFSR